MKPKPHIAGLLAFFALAAPAQAESFGVHYFYTGGDPSAFINSPDWRSSPITDVIYYSVRFTESGEFKPLSAADEGYFSQLKQWAKSSTPPREITLGMGTPASAPFLQDANKNLQAAQALAQYMDRLGADGLNVDIEYPASAVEQTAQLNFYRNLRSQLGGRKHLSVDVGPAGWMAATPGGHIPKWFATNGQVNWYGLMSYGAGNVNSIDFMKKFVAEYTVTKGAPKNRIVVGLPFFGKTRNIGAICYKTLAATLNSNDITSDTANFRDESFALNNVKTIESKVKWAKGEGLGGVMVWHWKCDNPPSSPQSLTSGIASGLK